jgi:thymidylate synthase (FAD)
MFLDSFYDHEPPVWRRDPRATPAECLIEFAGRVCYMSFGTKQSPKSNAEYIRNLIANGHESVLEHAGWTFVLGGISRAFTHQLVRHRVGFSFSQLSQQYHDESEAKFVRPTGIERLPKTEAAWERVTQQAKDAYKEILADLTNSVPDPSTASQREKSRLIRSIARSVLPNGIETAIVVTANARALRYFIKVRGTIVGDIEMRLAASAILQKIRPEAPSVFSEFEIVVHADGLPIVAINSTKS